jgi:hypothetical protein
LPYIGDWIGLYLLAERTTGGRISDDDENWLQVLVGLPFIGAWIGSAFLFVPDILFVMLVVIFGIANGTPVKSIHYNQDTGQGWGIFIVGVVHSAWLIALKKVMRVRLVMPVIPIPWLWLMILFAWGGFLQINGGPGKLSIISFW